jgi:hypothetical protein
VASSDTAACAAPVDYGELFLEYGDSIKRVIWKNLGPRAQQQDVDDGLSYIMQQFVKNDVIAQYKPGYISEFTQQPASFHSFIMAKVTLYCRHLRDKLARGDREMSIGHDVEPHVPGRWADSIVGEMTDYSSLGDSEVLARLREQLARREPAAGEVSLTAMFDAVAGRFADGLSVTPAGVRAELGLDRDGAVSLYGELREALREITDPTRFELGGVVLSAEQVRHAVAALRAAPGNRVLPAFAAASHPLAAAGKTWYLTFAADVLAEHPECRTPKGGHFPGGHFGRVKAALIYGLELMVGREPVAPARVFDERMWAGLEAILARLPGSSPAKTGFLLETIRVVLAEDVAVAA